MLPICYFNGELLKSDQASIGINDVALLRGYGIFDYFRFRDGQPVFMEDHIERFYRSADTMQLEVPLIRSAMEAVIAELADRNEAVNVGVRLLLTGGYSADGYHPGQPNFLIIMHPYLPPPDEVYKNGIHLLSHPYQREVPEVKTINYLMSLYLRNKLKSMAADDVLYHSNGMVTESSRANFFIVKSDDTIITSADKILKGITRNHLLKWAGDQLNFIERPLHLDEVLAAKEAFISSSNKGVMPVTNVDQQLIGDGKPGEITKQLMEIFAKNVDQLTQR